MLYKGMPIQRQQTRLQRPRDSPTSLDMATSILLSLKCAAAVLELFENLNCAVQSSSKSAASMISAMKMTVGALNDLRCKDNYQALFEEAVN